MASVHEKTLLFRVDANPLVGMGHLMRCLSVADAATRIGARCVFACADAEAAAFARRRGYDALGLNGDYRNLIPELERLHELACSVDSCVLIVDSYYAVDEFLEASRSIAHLAYFDDFGDAVRPADVVVNYNISADKAEYGRLYEGCSGTELLLGPSYAPLREQFRTLVPYGKRAEKSGVLVCVGGSDPERIALRFARALAADSKLRCGRRFTFMLGSSEPDLIELRRMEAMHGWLELREGVEDVAGLMCGFEVALSASGTTLYELCACGLPTVAYCLSDDQAKPLASFVASGAMANGGDLRGSGSVETALHALAGLLDDEKEMLRLSDAARSVVDGCGAERLAESLLGLCGCDCGVLE